MKKTYWLSTGIIFASFAIGIYLYPQMPATMASHWNSEGVADGYMSRFWVLFLMPLMTGGLFLLMLAVPKIDPLKRNVEKFRKYYDRFIVIFVSFMFYIYVLTILWSLSYRFNMGALICPAIGALFFYVGVLVKNAKRNWFIGIRTPWTLSSDRVWRNTHRIGGRMFKAAGVTAMLGAFLGKYAIYTIVVPVIFVAVYTITYSYFDYQKEKR